MQVDSCQVLDRFLLFVSYSREDSSIVAPLVELLRVSGIPIFRDKDSIPPGTKWRFQIATALENCEMVIVFWCKHAAASKEVKQEYRRAIKLGKAVVPVLLDSTDMPEILAQRQAIDLRTALGAHAEAVCLIETETDWRIGSWVQILRKPSEAESQRAGEYLIKQLRNLIVSMG